LVGVRVEDRPCGCISILAASLQYWVRVKVRVRVWVRDSIRVRVCGESRPCGSVPFLTAALQVFGVA
jgi:hypothetical protein